MSCDRLFHRCLLLLLLPACQPTISSGLQCGTNQLCPDGLVCDDGLCVRNPNDAGPAPDASMPSDDAAPPCSREVVFEKKLVAKMSASSDNLGLNVGLTGSYAAFGIGSYSSSVSGAGAIYVFDQSDDGWTQEEIVEADVPVEGEGLGHGIAAAGSWMVATAPGAQSSAGRAVVFHRQSGWQEIESLQAPSPAAGDRFGSSIDMSDATLVVGADIGGFACVFERTGGSYGVPEVLDEASLFFGSSVAVHGDVLVVGASGDGENGSFAGAAFVFERSPSGWTRTAKLLDPNGAAGDGFGDRVAVHGDWIAVAGSLAGEGDAGTVVLYEHTDAGWEMRELGLPDTVEDGDQFGSALAVAEDFLVVGALGDDDQGQNSGSAYVYRRGDNEWTLETKLLDPVASPEWRFGYSVAAWAQDLVVGSPLSGHGSAYVYQFACHD